MSVDVRVSNDRARADHEGGAQLGHAGAALTVTNNSQGIHTKTTSDAKGVFTFPSLPVGQYTLLAEAQGFADHPVDDMTVVVLKQLARPVRGSRQALQNPLKWGRAAADSAKLELDQCHGRQGGKWLVPPAYGLRRRVHVFARAPLG